MHQGLASRFLHTSSKQLALGGPSLSKVSAGSSTLQAKSKMPSSSSVKLPCQRSVLAAEKVIADSGHPHQGLDSRFEHTGSVQQAGFLPRAPHELQSNWQTYKSVPSSFRVRAAAQ